MPEKLSNNKHGHNKGERYGSPFFYGAFSGQESVDGR
jgi:hypothetical protein